MHGKFIVIEGIDGAGKTTQAELLYEALSKNYKVISTSEPTNGKIGGKIKEYVRGKYIDPTELQKLYVQDRKEHLEYIIQPSLADGCVVISDRYTLSNIAYSEKPEEIRIMNQDFIKPDLTIYIEMSPSEAMERIDDKSIFHNKDMLGKISDRYKDNLEHFNHVIVDGSKEVSELHNEILKHVNKLLE